jgi:diacylglycerol kinase family enzyme
VPLGTANVLARELGLPVRSPLSCAVVAGRGPCVRIGLGNVEGAGVFTFCASAGLDSMAVFNVDLGIKRQTGSWAYAYSGLQCLLAPAQYLQVTTDAGARFTAAQVFAARMRRYGAGYMFLSRRASLHLPTLRLIAVAPPLAPRLLRCLYHMLRGGLEGAPGTFDVEVSSFAVESDSPVPVQTDGDVLAHTPAVFSAVPDALSVVVPKTS